MIEASGSATTLLGKARDIHRRRERESGTLVALPLAELTACRGRRPGLSGEVLSLGPLLHFLRQRHQKTFGIPHLYPDRAKVVVGGAGVTPSVTTTVTPSGAKVAVGATGKGRNTAGITPAGPDLSPLPPLLPPPSRSPPPPRAADADPGTQKACGLLNLPHRESVVSISCPRTLPPCTSSPPLPSCVPSPLPRKPWGGDRNHHTGVRSMEQGSRIHDRRSAGGRSSRYSNCPGRVWGRSKLLPPRSRPWGDLRESARPQEFL